MRVVQQLGACAGQLASHQHVGAPVAGASRPAVACQRRRRAVPVLAAQQAGGQGRRTAEAVPPPPLAAVAAAQALAGRAVAAVAAVALLLASPLAAHAELQTISAREAQENAKPLKQQPVNKGRVWLLFTLGSAALFGATVVLENNEAWFPAISRANRAMRTSGKAEAQAEAQAQRAAAAEAQRLAAVQAERQADVRLQSAVLEGLAEAKQQQQQQQQAVTAAQPDATLASSAAPAAAAAAVAAAAAEPTAAAPAAEEAAEEEEEELQTPKQKVLFEITPEQIQRSAEQQAIAQLEQELQRRKATAPASGSGSEQ